MTQRTRGVLLSVPGIVVLGVGISTFAFWDGESINDDLVRAKEMTHYIQQGQLSLRDATAIAEKHVKGLGLEVACRLEAGKPETMPGKGKPSGHEPFHDSGINNDQNKPQGKAPELDKATTSGKRLVYEISCFANDKLHTVRVDGLTKEVIDSKERTSFAFGDPAKP